MQKTFATVREYHTDVFGDAEPSVTSVRELVKRVRDARRQMYQNAWLLDDLEHVLERAGVDRIELARDYAFLCEHVVRTRGELDACQQLVRAVGHLESDLVAWRDKLRAGSATPVPATQRIWACAKCNTTSVEKCNCMRSATQLPSARPPSVQQQQFVQLPAVQPPQEQQRPPSRLPSLIPSSAVSSTQCTLCHKHRFYCRCKGI